MILFDRRPRVRSAAGLPTLAALLVVVAVASGCSQDLRAGGGPTVTDSAGVALVVHPEGNHPLSAARTADLTLGGKETDTESFYRVSRYTVATDDAGRIHVMDGDNHRVLVFDADGSHVRTLGRQGEGPGELGIPAAMAVSPDGTVMIFDIAKRGLVTWDSTGAVVDGEAVPEGFFGGKIVHDGEALFAVLPSRGDEARGDRLVRRTADGDTTTLVVMPPSPRKPVTFESCGMSISGMAPLFHPTLRWSVGSGLLAVVTGPDYVVDLYRDGRHVRSVRRPMAPRPATAELAEREVGDGMRVMTQGGERVCDPADVAEERGYAPVVPAIGAVMISPDGRLWVQRYGVGDEPAVVDLFDGEGHYQGTFPGGTELPIAFLPDGRVIWTEKDEITDVERMVIGTMDMESGATP